MREEKYKELCKRIDNPSKLFRVLRDLDLHISEKIHTEVQEDSWKAFIQEHFKSIKEQNPNAPLGEIMKKLGREYRYRKNKGLKY